MFKVTLALELELRHTTHTLHNKQCASFATLTNKVIGLNRCAQVRRVNGCQYRNETVTSTSSLRATRTGRANQMELLPSAHIVRSRSRLGAGKCSCTVTCGRRQCRRSESRLTRRAHGRRHQHVRRLSTMCIGTKAGAVAGSHLSVVQKEVNKHFKRITPFRRSIMQSLSIGPGRCTSDRAS